MPGHRSSAMRSTNRPYEALLAKGEQRKVLILAAARQLLVRNGWRATSLAQIAKAAGVTSAGLLHHYESKDQLLHAVLEARDVDDELHADRTGDLLEELARVAERFERAPDLVSMFAVLIIENLQPDAPLHDRLHGRYRSSVDTIAEGIRRGQRAGRPRPGCQGRGDRRLSHRNGNLMATRPFDSPAPSAQRVHPITGSATGTRRQVLRQRLVALAPSTAAVMRYAGGWLFDRVLAGWDVTVLVADHVDTRPLDILGVRVVELEAGLATKFHGPIPEALAIDSDLLASDPRVRQRLRSSSTVTMRVSLGASLILVKARNSCAGRRTAPAVVAP